MTLVNRQFTNFDITKNKIINMKKNVLVFGLISGLVVSLTMAISMLTVNNNPEIELGNTSLIVGYLSMLVAFSLIYVAVKNFRDKQNNGLISFGKAFLMGLYICLIASTMYVIVWAFIYNVYMPDFMDKYSEQMLKAARATGTPAEIQEKTAEMAKYKELYKSPFFFTLMTYAEIIPVGLLVSLITALLLKKRNKSKVAAA
jgi:flagellar biosynthesis protein FliQ